MYCEHFGLDRPPFRITPDTSLFFEGNQRGAALEALHYAIKSGEGIIKVIGEVGSGKTMLCRMLELRLQDDSVDVVYIANPSLSPDNILHVIAHELQLDVDHATDKVEVMQKIQQHLLQKHAKNVHVVLFVEEAQSMPTETLEEIRLLSNLETDQNKLLQMVLFGQPELDEKLAQAHIRQLKERITHSFYLAPFPPDDILQYLNFRLRAVGYRGPDLFSARTAESIKHYSDGLTRRINILADKALLAAYSEGVHSITSRHIKTAAIDSEFSANRQSTKPWLQRSLWSGLAAVLMAGILYIGVLIGRSGLPPVLTTAVNADDKEIAGSQVSHDMAAQKPVLQSEHSRETGVASQPQAANQRLQPAPAKEQKDNDSIAIAHLPESNHDANHGNTAKKEKSVASTDLSEADRVAEKVQLTRQWLTEANDRNYSIQLFMARASNRKAVEEFLRKVPLSLDFSKIYVYETLMGGDSWYGIVYDEFDSYRKAMESLHKLPESLQASSPYLRRLSALKKEMLGQELG